MANFLNMQADERVTTMLVVPDFEDAEYVTLITRKARIKRMELNVFSNVRSTGLIAMDLDDDDSLDWARMTNGDQEFIIVTRNGKALRFHERNVRSMGRTAAGVRAMRLLGDDEIVSLDVVYPDSDLLVLHERGWGKRTSLEEFREKGRHTQGNWATDHRRIDEIGPIVAARVVKPNDQITVMTANGIVLRTGVAGISRLGRSTRGVRVVNLQDGDSVAALAVLTYEDLTREVDSRDDDDESPVEDMGGDAELLGDDDLHDELLDDADLDEGELDDGDFDDGEAALAVAEEDEQ
jgi:DNA gyrase subunit A